MTHFHTDKQIGEAIRRILFYADMRKHLADDEHMDPLPIYGVTRAYDRMPVAWPISPSERTVNVRAQYNVIASTTNPEEGA